MSSQTLYQMPWTTKMKFKKLLDQQVCKTHNYCNLFSSSSSLSVCLCVFDLFFVLLWWENRCELRLFLTVCSLNWKDQNRNNLMSKLIRMLRMKTYFFWSFTYLMILQKKLWVIIIHHVDSFLIKQKAQKLRKKIEMEKCY